jgi:hypothetical protein
MRVQAIASFKYYLTQSPNSAAHADALASAVPGQRQSARAGGCER